MTANNNLPRLDSTTPVQPPAQQEQATMPPNRSDTWEPVLPLDAHALPPFPLDALPGWLRDFVAAVAETTQTPLDLCGVLVLSVTAMCVAGKAEFVSADWREPLNLFCIIAMQPGSRKSGVFKWCTAPILAYEHDENAVRALDVAQAETERSLLEQRLTQAKQTAVRSKEANTRLEAEDECRKLTEQLANFRAPVLLRLFADDATPERLTGLMAEQGGRLAVLSAEGCLFDTLAGKYTGGVPSFEIFLKGHAGDSLRVDRVGRPSEHLDRPALTLGLCVQPDIVRGLAHKPGFRGRGLLARFLFSLPPDIVGFRSVMPPPTPPDVEAMYAEEVRRLLSLTPQQNEAGEEYPHTLNMTPEAQETMTAFAAHIERCLKPGGDFDGMRDWGSKLCGLVARLAGILHVCAYSVTGEICLHTLTCAINLGLYASQHAKAAFSLMGQDADLDAARAVLTWITQTQQTRFSKRNAHHALQGRFHRADELDAPLSVLVERGYIREEPAPEKEGAGRKPSPVFLVNPCLNA